jgi:hypothetical protein
MIDPNLSPSDGAVALRSLPRRFKAVLGFDDDESPDDLVHRPGPDGHSAVDHAAHVARSLALIGEALRQVVTVDEPVLHPGVIDESAREWPAGHPDSTEEVLALLEREATQLADQVDRVAPDDWTRKGRIAGGGLVTALDLMREAVRTGVDHLHAAESTLHALRGR